MGFNKIKTKIESLKINFSNAIQIGSTNEDREALKKIQSKVNVVMKQIDKLSQKVWSIQNVDERNEMYKIYLELASKITSLDGRIDLPDLSDGRIEHLYRVVLMWKRLIHHHEKV